MRKFLKKIKVLVMDVDGTLTDGQINIGQNGELFKSFYCRDGLGILHAAKAGIVPVILTSRVSNIVKERAKEIGITHVLQGAGDVKKEVLDRFMDENSLTYDEIAYIGDDVNDLECMKACKVKASPADAVEEIKIISDYVCENRGGHGAVREFIELLIENNQCEEG